MDVLKRKSAYYNERAGQLIDSPAIATVGDEGELGCCFGERGTTGEDAYL